MVSPRPTQGWEKIKGSWKRQSGTKLILKNRSFCWYRIFNLFLKVGFCWLKFLILYSNCLSMRIFLKINFKRLEQAQRERRKLRVEPWEPTWFEQRIDPVSGDKMHFYRGTYWSAKEKQEWSKCPVIFDWLSSGTNLTKIGLNIGLLTSVAAARLRQERHTQSSRQWNQVISLIFLPQ